MKSWFVPLIALATLVGFLGILAWKVPSLDLLGVIVISLALVLWDLYSSVIRPSRNN